MTQSQTPSPKPGRHADAVAFLIYLTSLALSVHLFWQGGLAALLGALIGAIVGLWRSRGQERRADAVITASFTGLWAGIIVGALFGNLHIAQNLNRVG